MQNTDFSLWFILGYDVYLIVVSIVPSLPLKRRIERRVEEHFVGSSRWMIPKRLIPIFVLGVIGTAGMFGFPIVHLFMPTLQDHLLPFGLFQIWPVTATGCALIVIGALITTVGVATVGIPWTTLFPKEKTELVTSSIYGISRNPQYIGHGISLLGFVFILPNLLTVVCHVFYVINLHFAIRNEERWLLRIFGEEYARYCRRVKRYL